MKLRNKKTGEIIDFDSITDLCFGRKIQLQATNRYNKPIYIYNSLAELNRKWEDYEEPKDKGYWYIDDLCRMRYSSELLDEIGDRPNNWMIRKLCGNYFSSIEEAKKAVEKLKAWKRLKDKGFRFEGWDNTDHSTIHNFSLFVAIEDLESINKDLDLLFGGEE